MFLMKNQTMFLMKNICDSLPYKFVNGDVYVGDWEDGKRHGHGTYKLFNGDVYVGEWKYGKVNKSIYIGEWK